MGSAQQFYGEVPYHNKATTSAVGSHFYDSGSFSLVTKAREYAKKHKTDPWAYYDTKEFWNYIDNYAKFVSTYKIGIDLYSNVDVIYNPKLTWRNQEYLEQIHRLSPVPVVHFATDLIWLEKYLQRGYSIISFGGLVKAPVKLARQWLDSCFNFICSQQGTKNIPCVKIHGFGVTSFNLMRSYPWWSVDSSSWAKAASFGAVYIPPKRGVEYVFTTEPIVIDFSTSSSTMTNGGITDHYYKMSPPERKIVLEWLEKIGVPLGKNNSDDTIKEIGVINHHSARKKANLHYFEEFRKSLPPWPWPFRRTKVEGFGFL